PDVGLRGREGRTGLGRFCEKGNEVPVLVVTAFGDLPTAVKAVEGGAFDYLTKPFDLAQALDALRRAMNRPPPPDGSAGAPPLAAGDEIVGRSPAMQAVFERIALEEPRDAWVIIR